MSETPWMDTEEAVMYLRYASRDALYMAVRRGQIPANRRGRNLIFHRPTIDAYLAKRTTQHPDLK
jgi:excisionase family DNA binding protein